MKTDRRDAEGVDVQLGEDRVAIELGGALKRRQHGVDPRAVEIGWRAQRRLHRRWARLRVERGKPANVARIALARELGCFVWEVGQLG